MVFINHVLSIRWIWWMFLWPNTNCTGWNQSKVGNVCVSYPSKNVWASGKFRNPSVSVSHFLRPYIDKASVITTTNITKSLYYLRKEMGGEWSWSFAWPFADFLWNIWPHIRTTNLMGSAFATVSLRTPKTSSGRSRWTVLTMVFQLGGCTEKTWKRLRGSQSLVEIIEEAEFVDGEKLIRKASWSCQT